MSAFAESLKPAEQPAEQPEAAPAESSTPAAPPAAPAEVPAEKGEIKQARTPADGVMGALKSERQKRQEAERQLEYYRGLADASQGRAKPKDQGPTKEELENEYLLDPRGVTEKLSAKHVEERSFEIRANMSHEFMLELKPDYMEKLQGFLELAKENPDLLDAAKREQAPAMAIYRFMTNRAKAPVDEASLRKTIEAEVEARLRKELALKEASDTVPTPAGKPGGGAPAATDDVPTVEQLFEKRRSRGR